MNEFEIIHNYFAKQGIHRTDVIHGIGDDTAIVAPPTGHELAITTDTLVEGVHFFASSLPYDIGYKSLAVNLSDLAAMGATPAWFTVALTTPKPDSEWIAEFCHGLFALANRYQIQLIGGDLTQGPLTITIQALGFIPTGKSILRHGAKPGDSIYVTGTLGDAGLALAFLQKKVPVIPVYQAPILMRLNRPEPRILQGKQLLDLANAAIDISDGLAADLSHILETSQVGANIFIDQLPLSQALKNTLPYQQAIQLALTAGDDYELCFTIPADKRQTLENCTCIGEITKETGLKLYDAQGRQYTGPVTGYQHFK